VRPWDTCASPCDRTRFAIDPSCRTIQMDWTERYDDPHARPYQHHKPDPQGLQ
jgi:hypothetical protein